MTRLRSAIALLLAATSTNVALASEAKPDDQIVVTGKTEKEVREEAKGYAESIGHASGNVQAARWVDAVCPKAMGISDDIAKVIEERVREVTERVGARVAKPRCSPNFAIVFAKTADAAKILRSYSMLRKELEADRSSPSAGKALPIRWWYNTEMQGRNGHKISPIPPPSLPTNMPLPMFTPDFNTVYEPGRFEASTRRVIQRAFVLIDLDQANGKFLNSLIDYAAFVGLAEVRLGASSDNSILSLFGTETPSTQLTKNDVTYLKTLYSMPMNRSGQQQRGTFVNGMTKDRDEADFSDRE
jgi:hypothetical protein